MSTPVAAVSSAPTFGGLTGFKRPVLGKPTQVPTNLPAFRGKPYTPGSDNLKAPAIQNSKNRQDRGTNVTIPYARTCPIDHSRDLGRIAPGDVVFTSRYQVETSHVGHRKERVVGIDFLNKALGNDDSTRAPRASINPNWVVGKTVLIGGSSDDKAEFDSVGGIMADNWREAALLQDYCCDGVLLSNDEPYAHTSNGANDVQQFNICVQGYSTCNNGFQDYKGRGVEAYPRSMTERHGYGKEGNVAIGGVPYYPSYPMQMFDRKVKPLSTLYVGLVATKRLLTPEIKRALKENSNLSSESLDYKKLDEKAGEYTSFYTFKFVCFSDRAARQGAFQFKFRDDWKYAEPPSKKQKPVHQNDVPAGSTAFDPFEPVSLTDYRGMVGAWKIGKVMDTAARRRDVYSGGPIDTADQLTVNVCIEWCDWRKLRRSINREDIAGYVSGAPMWLNSIPASAVAEGKAEKPTETYNVDVDDKRIFNWPSVYVTRASTGLSKVNDADAEKKNTPLDMERTTTDMKFKLKTDSDAQTVKYLSRAKDASKYIQDDSTPIGTQTRITLSRQTSIKTKLTKDEVEKIWVAIAGMNNTMKYYQFYNWVGTIKPDADGEKSAEAVFGVKDVKNMPPTRILQIYTQMSFFTNGQPRTRKVSKQMFTDFLLPDQNKSTGSGVSAKDLATSVGDSMVRAVEVIIDHDIDMTDGMDGTGGTHETPALSAPTSANGAESRSRGSKKSKSTAPTAPSTPSASSTPSAPSIPSAVAAVTTGASAASGASGAAASTAKPSAKPAAKSVSSTSNAPAPTASTASTANASETSDIFSAIFGESSSAAEPEKSPSSGNPKSRVRRAREGR